MKPFRHTVRQQTIELEVESQALALALQPRMGDFNRRRLLPVIERLFDELAVPGRQIRLRRLEVDLGTITAARFEEEVERRLERELRRVLEEALHRLREHPEEGDRSQPEEVSRRELLESYLLRGTLPFWAPGRSDLSLEELVLGMIGSDPEGLVGIVLRLGHRLGVLERIVAQLGEPVLQRLIGLLEPEHAALIIAYIGNLQEVHRGERKLPMSERAFTRILWVLTQAYLVQDAGSQFNRRSFVKSLLRGVAASEGLDYLEILALLRLGLERTARKHPIRSSLPAVVSELMREVKGRDEEMAGGGEPAAELAPLARVEPRRRRVLVEAAKVLTSAWREAAPSGAARTGRGALWSFLLGLLARSPASGASLEKLVTGFFEHVAGLRGSSSSAPGRAAAMDRILEKALRLARSSGQAGLAAVLHRNRRRLRASWQAPKPAIPVRKRTGATRADRRPAAKPSQGRTAFNLLRDTEPGEEKDPIYIDNAGLVLTSPFLPQLFDALDLLGSDEAGRPRLRDTETASRAVHLLQFLVDGRTSAPEPLLVLNKILCGLPTGAPVDREIELTDRERETCETMLRSMLANWEIIKDTSIAGLQETFMLREGRLQTSSDGWKLRVQRKTVDVLVDQVPWSLAVVFHRWMPQPLYVTW